MSLKTNTTDHKKMFSQRLQELMDENGTTQQMLADYCGFHRQSIAKWQSGQTSPDIDGLSKIADFFNVSTDYLSGRSDIKTTNTATQELCQTLGLSEDTINFLQKQTTLYYKFPDISDSDGDIKRAVATVNALMKDHIEFMTNANNRNDEDDFSLIMLLTVYLEHIELNGSVGISGGKNNQYLTMDTTDDLVISQEINPSRWYFDTCPLKDILITKDINAIIAFLQKKKMKGISRNEY